MNSIAFLGLNHNSPALAGLFLKSKSFSEEFNLIDSRNPFFAMIGTTQELRRPQTKENETWQTSIYPEKSG